MGDHSNYSVLVYFYNDFVWCVLAYVVDKKLKKERPVWGGPFEKVVVTHIHTQPLKGGL